jgi:hypothetical protein
LFVIKGVLQILRFAPDDRKRFAPDDRKRFAPDDRKRFAQDDRRLIFHSFCALG